MLTRTKERKELMAEIIALENDERKCHICRRNIDCIELAETRELLQAVGFSMKLIKAVTLCGDCAETWILGVD